MTNKEVRIALSFSKVMSAVEPFFWTLTSLPQKEKKSCNFSSVVSGARPATWMVYPGAIAAAAEVDIVVVVIVSVVVGSMGWVDILRSERREESSCWSEKEAQSGFERGGGEFWLATSFHPAPPSIILIPPR